MKNAATIAIGFIVSIALSFGALAGDLQDVRFGPGEGKTRIVFDLNGAPSYTLSGSEQGQGLLFVDFEGLNVPQAKRGVQPAKGHVANYEFTDMGRNRVRAHFTFKKSAKIKDVFVIEPSGAVTKHRLVIDLLSAEKTAFLASIPARYPDLGTVIEEATAPAKDVPVLAVAKPVELPLPPVKKPPPKKRVIVVDAGHGGRDPGAIGAKGTYEKTVTMLSALQLRDILEKTGRYKVVLTRESDKDKRIRKSQKEELARREALARDAGAELFISLHADALADKNVRGASIYTLSDKGSARSAQLAKSEGNFVVYDLNAADFGDGVSDILFDLAQSTTSAESNRFAELLIEELEGKTALLNKTHRKADFRVLLAPDVPAVLFEIAFMSNVKDEANLNNAAWRARMMGSVAKAIDLYFDEESARYAQRSSARGG